MSRGTGFDRARADDLHPGRRLVEGAESPLDLLHRAAGLLEHHGSTSSECRATAERLRRLARALAAQARAEATEQAVRRRQAERVFQGDDA